MQKKGYLIIAKQYKSILFFLLKIVFGGSCIFFIHRAGVFDLDVLFDAIKTSPLRVLFGFFLVIGMIFMGNVRWYLVMRLTGVNFSFANTIFVGLIGIFFATFTPGGVTSDLMRSYYSSGEKKISADSMLAVVIDRGGALTGQLMTAVLCGILVFDQIRDSIFEIPYFIISALFVCIVLLVGSFYFDFLPKIFLRFAKGRDYLSKAQRTPVAFIVATLISSVNSILLGASLFVFSSAVMEVANVGFVYFLFAGPFIAISLTIPLTPAGLGTGQIGGYLLFNNMTNQSIDCGTEIVTLVQLSWMLIGLLGAAVFVMYKKKGVTQ